jgi:ATP-dependent RNA helicase DDX31/DBP7
VHDLAAQQPPITRAQGTFAIVICPTRELCLQVADVLTMLARRFVWLVGGAVHGGEHRGKEKARLRKGVTVVVATPGRLLDHLQNTQAFRTGGGGLEGRVTGWLGG